MATPSIAPTPWWLDWNELTYANPDIYGPLVGGNTVQEAIYHTLETWLPAYIFEFNRVLGGPILKVPKEYRVKPDNRTLTKEVEASILVICTGTNAPPTLNGHDTRATWQTQVSVCVGGSMDWQETQAITYAYGVAVRAAIAQHKGLGGVAETTVWTGERYLEKEHLATRTIGLLVIDFLVTTPTTIDPFAGPPSPQYGAPGASEPSLEQPDDAPMVTDVSISMENYQI